MLTCALITIFGILNGIFIFLLWRKFDTLPQQQNQYLQQHQQTIIDRLHEQNHQTTRYFNEMRNQFDANQLKSLEIIQSSLQLGLQTTTKQVNEALVLNADNVIKRVDKLTEIIDIRLKEISGQVDKRLTEGFEKTTATFADIVKRLALIDEAQKKITELSGNVVNLQELLADKRSRGAYGEVQLATLIHNVIPEGSAIMQYSLSNHKRCDCILLLPDPTGNIAIDAKFPLENYRLMTNINLPGSDRDAAKVQFKKDVKIHIRDIAAKYIIPGETADGAMMFIPAEAIFAEIHSSHPDIVEAAYKARVWMVSPTTMMAVLTTAAAVIKDAATRKQVHAIQEHLRFLARDFGRFQKRMDKLEKHIDQAQGDIKDAQTSARKITSRFVRIERADLDTSDIIEKTTEEASLIEVECDE